MVIFTVVAALAQMELAIKPERIAGLVVERRATGKSIRQSPPDLPPARRFVLRYS
ncbi:hypothetical protein ACH9D2_11365 [Kocuria sp. M4R2S49]|uniref:hypothetical protein n=1 Tax=Kocuria rhizosphaericola TaxID=3376284 RepID=UPI0037944201